MRAPVWSNAQVAALSLEHPYDLQRPSQGPPLSILSAASSFPDIFAQIVCPLTLRAVDSAIQFRPPDIARLSYDMFRGLNSQAEA